MARVYESDVYGTGKPEVILENPLLRVIVSPHLGGRIVDVESGGRKFLYTTYPECKPSGFYSEYGGIEDFLDRPPGNLWRLAWRSEIEGDCVSLSIKWNNIFLEKRISLDGKTPVVKMEYSFLNFGPNLIRPAFGIHPEIRLNDEIAANCFHIPTRGGVLSGGCEQTKKRYVRPSEGWCASTGEGSLMAMLFPHKLLDGAEVFYPESGTHLSLSPLIYYLGLSPGKEARFACAIYFGEGDAGSAAELWREYADKLPTHYAGVSKDRLEMARNFKSPEPEEVPTGTEESEERRNLLEKMDRLEEGEDERMEILRLLREKQISATEGIKRLRLMKESPESGFWSYNV